MGLVMLEKVEIKRHFKYIDYGADELGNIYSFKNKKCRKLKPTINGRYLRFDIYFNFKKNKILTSRFIWECFNGLIPTDLEVCHNDNNTKNDKLNNLNISKYKDFFMPNLTAKGKINSWYKLTLKEVLQIKKEYKDGRTLNLLAKKFNVRLETIWKIINNVIWKIYAI